MSQLVAKTPYSTVVREIIGGNEYLKFSSSPAVTVLLCSGDDTVYLMSQSREDSGGKVFFKTVGGYLNPGESPAEGAKRNLLSKVGVVASEFHQTGYVSGYGDAIKIPITPLVCGDDSWYVSTQPKSGIALVGFNRAELYALLSKEDAIYDDATRIQVLQFLAGIF